MATEEFVYLSYPEAVAYHIELMEYLGETRFGVFDKTLIESALARPQQAAAFPRRISLPKPQLSASASLKITRGSAGINEQPAF